ncbi:chitinase [Fusarium proliferatum]|nr:chitinase [Fusarium proliferatum]
MPPFTLQGTITVLMVLVALISPLASALPSLRILPLGDSITKGNGSKDQKGYRNRLREKLIGRGTSVDMVGSLKHPPTGMADNDHEGHSGKVLAQINTYWKLSIAARPNVVLVHAGTNNMDLEVDLEGSPNMLASIVDGLFQNAPDTTVLVAPVIWANNPRMQKNTDRFNPQVISIIEERQKAGKHILEVPIDINAGDLSDEKHPNDNGYEKMADTWLKAILEADKRGWLKAPTKIDAAGLPGVGLGVGGGAGGAQEEIVGKIWKKQGTVFEGFRTWDSVGTIRGSAENSSREKVILADLNGDGIADYALADKDGKIRAWINGGKPNDWKSIGYINPDWKSVTGDMIRFADVDNDGKADLIALYEDGAAKVWKNVDNGKKFESLDSRWATGLTSRDKVRFEDIDGDGYADYVVVYDGGAVKWARNTHNNGKDSSKKNWETETTIAPGPAGIPQDSTSIRDIDGDGKADYLVIYQGGAVKAFRNTLKEGGRNWDDLGTIAPGIEGVTGEMIRFADMDGDGLADFLAVTDDGSIRMWKNLGITGTKGQSIRFADLTGEGRDDLISVDSRGRARAWINKGDNKWEAIGEIAPGFDEDLSDSRIEFIDVNGDKRADYLIIYGGGAVKAYLNNGNLPDPGNRRIWQDGITISPGVGEPGSKVRFADLDGDGYADFLILYEGGAVKYWQNNKNIPPRNGGRIWKEGIVVATGVGEPGSKVRFADLTGDGKADYIVQYDGGAARGYRNNGKIPIGEGRKWNDMGTIAAGVSPQGPVHYADINGDRKADYLVVFDGGATTISFPVITETFKETWPETTSGVTKYGTTTITVKITLPPLVTSEIGVSNVILTESTSISVPVRGSVIPSPVTLTEPTHGITYTYKPGPLPTNDVNIGPPPGIAPGVIITAGPPGPICKSGCGCFLTATATTTGASCPLTPVDYGDDFGDDNNALGNLGSTYKTTFAASVIVSSTPYPVNDGYATVDRTAYSIPDVESASKTKMRGTSAVILPSYVGTTISVTIKGISFITTSYPKATTTFGETTTTEPSETTTSYPTNTAINEAEAYCYEGDTNYVEFTKDEARQVIGSFCDSSYTLDPGNTFGQNVALEEDGYTVIVSAKWAPDQSGCGDKEPFSFSEDDWNHDLCLGGWTAGYSCPNDEEDRQSSYGGAYVLDPPENGGCLLLSLYAYDTSTMRLKALPKGAESLIPPVMNVTHMGEKKEWIANDKFDGRRMWPVAESTTHGGKPSTTGVVQTKNSS